MTSLIAHTEHEQYAAACLIVTSRGVIGNGVDVREGLAGDVSDGLRAIESSIVMKV
jgi:hypothetical protein